MKRLILIALCLLCCASAHAWESMQLAWMGAVGVGGGVPAVSDTYTDILFWWRCEGTTLGTDDYSAGDTSAQTSSGAAINTDAKQIGDNGCAFPGNEDKFSFSVSSGDIINSSAGRIGFWLKVNTWVNDAFVLYANDGSGNKIVLYLSNGDELTLNWKDATNNRYVETSGTGTFVVDTWYYIEISWNTTTNLIQIIKDGSVIKSGSSDISDILGINIIYFGIYSNLAASMYVDNIVISNDDTRDLYVLRNLTESPR